MNSQAIKKAGVIKDPELLTEVAQKGWFFNLKHTEVVRNVFVGQVSFVGHVNGFGETVIVHHGQNYYSVYGSLDEVTVQLGKRVQANDPIGRSGSKTSFKGRGLYYEIRHFSENEDPEKWFQKLKRYTVDNAA